MISSRSLTVAVTALALAGVVALALPSGSHAQTQTRPATNSAAPAPGANEATRFEVRPGGMSRATFTSDAPLETFDGTSTDVAGNFTVNLANPSAALTGRVTVGVAGLRTGSDMRDEHLRSNNWLDAQRFPQITFELVSTDLRGPITPNTPASGTVRGRLTIHGVTREVNVPVTVRHVPLTAEHANIAQFGVTSDMFRVQTNFAINLSDYGVSINPLFRLKVSNEQRLRADFTAFRAR